MENGHVAPGDLIVGTDSHCTIYGSLGALGHRHRLYGSDVGVAHREALDEGAGDVQDSAQGQLLPGRLFKGSDAAPDRHAWRRWLHLQLRGVLRRPLQEPERVRTNDDDQPRHGDGRKVCVRAARPEDAGLSFVEAENRPYEEVHADPDAVYSKTIDVDVSDLEPMVACPHEVENTKPIGEVRELPSIRSFSAHARTQSMRILRSPLQFSRDTAFTPTCASSLLPVQRKSCWRP